MAVLDKAGHGLAFLIPIINKYCLQSVIMYHIHSSIWAALLSALLLFTSLEAWGYDFMSGGIYYNINADGTTVSVTYQGTYQDIENWTYIQNDYSGNIVIPSTVHNAGISYTVTEIGDQAFSNSNVHKVSIPNSVTKIGNNAFRECRISEVIIPNSVTEIEAGAFYRCSSLTTINLPQHLKVISSHTFEQCGLTSIECPPSVTTIESYAFWSSKLKSIYIPAGVTSIGQNAFSFCHDLTSIRVNEDNPVYDSRQDCNALIKTAENRLVTACDNTVIPNTITTIDNHAFDGCDSMKSIVIPASVTSIGSWAFAYCSSLTQVTCLALTPPKTAMEYSFGNYSKSTLYVPNDALGAYKADPYWSLFSNIVGINSVNKFKSNSIWYMLTSQNTVKVTNVDDHEQIVLYSGDIVIPEWVNFEGKNYQVTSIEDAAFKDNTQLTGIEIQGSISVIPWRAFYGCTRLTNVSLPDDVTSLMISAFEDCESLSSINLPNSITTIDNFAFENCANLTNLDLPSSLTEIGISAFRNCTGLQHLFIPARVSLINNNAFTGCTGLTDIQVATGNTKFCSPDNCNAIIEKSSRDLILGCVNTIIPGNTRWIGPYSFCSCKGLKNIVIPRSVSRIARYSFADCSDLESITLASNSNLTEIMDHAFDRCTSLKSIDIPNQVTFIDNNAFSNCKSLNHIGIPESITTLTESLCYGCSSLTNVTLPSSIQRIYGNAFGNCSSLRSVTCKGNTPPSMASYTCFNNYDKLTLYVPRNAVSAYRSTNYWNKFGQIIGVTNAGLCDVNGDNEVNISDINVVVDFILANEMSPYADVNADGEINIGDINMIADHILEHQ